MYKQLGDVVVTTCVPRELKKLYPDAIIDFAVFTSFVDILRHNPYINEVIPVNRSGGVLGTVRDVLLVKASKYDYVFDYQGTPRSLYHSFFSGAKTVIYDTSRRKAFYDLLVPMLRGVFVGYKKLNFLQALTDDSVNFDVQSYNPQPEIFVPNDILDSVKSKLLGVGVDIENGDRYVTLTPVHKFPARRWAAQKYLKVVKQVVERGFKVVLTYGTNDELEYLNTHFADVLSSNVVISPKTTILELCGLIKLASLHIGNVSGPSHIAVGVNTRSFLILNCIELDWIYQELATVVSPLEFVEKLECYPCNERECGRKDGGVLYECRDIVTYEGIVESKLERLLTEI